MKCLLLEFCCRNARKYLISFFSREIFGNHASEKTMGQAICDENTSKAVKRCKGVCVDICSNWIKWRILGAIEMIPCTSIPLWFPCKLYTHVRPKSVCFSVLDKKHNFFFKFSFHSWGPANVRSSLNTDRLYILIKATKMIISSRTKHINDEKTSTNVNDNIGLPLPTSVILRMPMYGISKLCRGCLPLCVVLKLCFWCMRTSERVERRTNANEWVTANRMNVSWFNCASLATRAQEQCKCQMNLVRPLYGSSKISFTYCGGRNHLFVSVPLSSPIPDRKRKTCFNMRKVTKWWTIFLLLLMMLLLFLLTKRAEGGKQTVTEEYK